MSAGILKYRDSKVPRQAGEYARIRILRGPDQGAVFVIQQTELVIGRGREAQIRVADVKVSRSHGRLYFTSQGWKVDDLGSANGIFFDGEFVRTFRVSSGDHFTIGDTVFEFLSSRETTQVLTAPIQDDPELEKREVALAQQKLRIRGLAEPVRVVARAGAKKGNRTPILILGLLVAAAYSYPDEARVFLGEAGLEFLAEFLPPPTRSPGKSAARKEAADRTLSSYAPVEVSADAVKTSEGYYRQGFREYMVGNHLRARALFELALQVNPGHERARFYLASAIHENKEEVERLIARSKQLINIGRKREAKSYLNAAIRRTGGDEKDPNYTACIEALKVIESGGKQ